MQFIVEQPGPNDTAQQAQYNQEWGRWFNYWYWYHYSKWTYTRCPILNSNTQYENRSIASQVSDRVPSYISQTFKDDLSKFFGAADESWGEYKA